MGDSYQPFEDTPTLPPPPPPPTMPPPPPPSFHDFVTPPTPPTTPFSSSSSTFHTQTPLPSRPLPPQTAFPSASNGVTRENALQPLTNWPLTSDGQIARLLRPGSKYFNLNPFEVLLLSPEATMEDAKKQYRKLSMLVHPDKNQDNERAQVAFDVVNRAYKEMQDKETFDFCKKIVEEAKKRVEEEFKEEKGKKKTSEEEHTGGNGSNNNNNGVGSISSVDTIRYEQAVRICTFKLFAELEQKKQKMDQREVEERKRKREEELSMLEKGKQQEEWNKKWEESRDARVNTWRSFVGGSKSDTTESSSTPLVPPSQSTSTSSSSSTTTTTTTTLSPSPSSRPPPSLFDDNKKKKKRAKVFRPPALKTESRK